MTILEEVLTIKTEEYKKKSFNELALFINDVGCFITDYRGKSFCFEIHVQKIDDLLYVMVECSRNIFLLDMFCKHKYFSVSQKNDVRYLEGNEFWGTVCSGSSLSRKLSSKNSTRNT